MWHPKIDPFKVVKMLKMSYLCHQHRVPHGKQLHPLPRLVNSCSLTHTDKSHTKRMIFSLELITDLKEKKFLIFSDTAFVNGNATFGHFFLHNECLVHAGAYRGS